MVVVAEMEEEEVEEGLEEEEHIGKMALNLSVNCAIVLATLCGSAIFDLIRILSIPIMQHPILLLLLLPSIVLRHLILPKHT